MVLHAHLPYARADDGADQLAHRWLLEALWESYLPIVQVLRRLATEEIPAPLTWSVSPPLASMLKAPGLDARFCQHLDRLMTLNAVQHRRAALFH